MDAKYDFICSCMLHVHSDFAHHNSMMIIYARITTFTHTKQNVNACHECERHILHASAIRQSLLKLCIFHKNCENHLNTLFWIVPIYIELQTFFQIKCEVMRDWRRKYVNVSFEYWLNAILHLCLSNILEQKQFCDDATQIQKNARATSNQN